MQNLHLVGVNLTRDGLIFSDRRGSGSGSFLVPVDRALAEIVAQLMTERGSTTDAGTQVAVDAPHGESQLSVREIQARLRTGRTVDEVAVAAGVSPEWIERFAPPVRAEQQRVIAIARDVRFERPRLGPSHDPLGRAVAKNLAAKGVRLTPQEFDAGWSAHHTIDRRWVVQHTHTHRGRAHVSSWELDEERSELSARDRKSAELGHVGPAAGPAADSPAAVPKRKPSKKATKAKKPQVTRDPEAAESASVAGAVRPGPFRPSVAPAQSAEPESDGWAEALEWLALNDRPDTGSDELSAPLLRLIENDPEPLGFPVEPEPDLELEFEPEPDLELGLEFEPASSASLVDASPAPTPPNWVSSGDRSDADDQVAVEDEPLAQRGNADPLAFLGESGPTSASRPARIDADPVAPPPAPSEPERSATDDDPIDAAEPDAPSPQRRSRPLRAR